MIGTQEIEEIITYTLFSGYVKDEVPVSLLIVAEVEGGKSELARTFAGNAGVAFPHDLTAYGIVRAYGRKLAQGELRHIIFPEFVHCLVRQPETVKTLLAFLNGLIAEGVKEIHTFRTNFTLPQPISCGIICCVTTEEFKKWRSYWEGMGFLSRLLPVSYSYSQRIEDEIFESIFGKEYSIPSRVELTFPGTPVEVKFSKLLARLLKSTAKDVGNPIKIRGFRPQIALQKLCEARALANGRDAVLREDIERVKELAHKYMNFNYTEIGEEVKKTRTFEDQIGEQQLE